MFTEMAKQGRITPVSEFSATLFRRSAAVAQLTVNQLVAGSNPAAGAMIESRAEKQGFLSVNRWF